MGPTNIALVELTSTTHPWTEGGFIHLGDGAYRVDLPPEAVIAGEPVVTLNGSIDDGVVVEQPCILIHSTEGVL